MSVTDDAFLGGQLNILQPRQGYRAGLDAVMLAAAVEARGAPFRVLDAGAGVGTAGLCVAWRCPEARVVLVEREPELVRLAEENVARNGLGDRVSVVEADVSNVTARELARCGLSEASFDQVIANPPYHIEGAGTAAGNDLKAAAHAMPEAEFDSWWRFLARMAKPSGRALMIHKASALPDMIEAANRRFGGLVAMPLFSRTGEPAHRVLLGGIKGSRAEFRLDAGFVVHEQDGDFTPGARDVLRLGRALRVAYGTTREADAAS